MRLCSLLCLFHKNIAFWWCWKKCNNLHVVWRESPDAQIAKSDETMNNSTYNGLHLGDTYKWALHQRKIKPQYSTFTHKFKSTSLPHLSLFALWDSLETIWLLTVLTFLRQKFPLFRSYPWVFFWQNRQFSSIIWSQKISILLHCCSVLFCTCLLILHVGVYHSYIFKLLHLTSVLYKMEGLWHTW